MRTRIAGIWLQQRRHLRLVVKWKLVSFWQMRTSVVTKYLRWSNSLWGKFSIWLGRVHNGVLTHGEIFVLHGDAQSRKAGGVPLTQSRRIQHAKYTYQLVC